MSFIEDFKDEIRYYYRLIYMDYAYYRYAILTYYYIYRCQGDYEKYEQCVHECEKHFDRAVDLTRKEIEEIGKEIAVMKQRLKEREKQNSQQG